MKLNWGHGILITIIICTSGILLMVFLSSREKIDLVTEDYYPKELVYEDHLDKIRNTQSLKEKIVSVIENDTLRLKFPEIMHPDSISGHILFYYPADKYGDITRSLKLDSAYSFAIALNDFRKGRYDIQIDWTALDTAYFQKETIILD